MAQFGSVWSFLVSPASASDPVASPAPGPDPVSSAAAGPDPASSPAASLASSSSSSDTEDEVIQPFPAMPSRPTMAMRVLTAWTRLRNPEQRSAEGLNLGPNANLEAVLLQIVGIKNEPGCRHCRRGNGKFVLCCSVPSVVEGSCGNCHWGNEGSCCSLRPGASAASVAAAINALPVPDAFGDLAAAASPTTRGTRRRALLTAVNPSAPLPAGFAAPSRVYPRASGPARAPLGGMRAPRRSRAERLHALARHHLAPSDRHQVVSEEMREMSGHHREIAIVHEEEADRLNEDGDIS
ncbi:MAG: hypothetical protein M1829_001102 [Trizodia sp. TS-e1964]|nr:MAG: hypothetical protein M1829_001102 [Trizodia sp. TS-e1964]